MVVFTANRLLETLQRAAVRGPTFIRLLARLTDVDISPSQPSPADRLGQWIDWTRAVALSRALDGKLPAVDSNGSAFDSAEEAAYSRIRTSLATGIASVSALATPRQNTASAALDVLAPVDYAVFHQHYLATQRAMQMATGKLRGHLRDLLAATSADMARLAEVDALMESVLSPRENKLLAAVPSFLGEHFKRLQAAAHEADGKTPTPATNAWLDQFRKDQQGVLHAELEVRFLPIEALIAALRTHSQGSHV